MKNKFQNKSSAFLASILVLGLLCFSSSQALAYIGPGLGVALIWTLLGPIAALVTVALILGYYPARYFYKKYKASKKGVSPTQKPADKEEGAPPEERG